MILKKHIILTIFICLSGVQVFSQTDVRPIIEKGNTLYQKEEYKQAAVQYKHACMLDSLSFDAWYNFGNALYKSGKYILASEAYKKALNLTSNLVQKASVLHNLGNSECEQKLYKSAIEYYKQSLLIQPTDNDTRYNLAYAQQQLKKNENEENKNEDENKDKKQDEPSEFAKSCLKQAQVLVQQYKFEEALLVMQDGQKKDKTVSLYQKYIQKLADIVYIIKNQN